MGRTEGVERVRQGARCEGLLQDLQEGPGARLQQLDQWDMWDILRHPPSQGGVVLFFLLHFCVLSARFASRRGRGLGCALCQVHTCLAAPL